MTTQKESDMTHPTEEPCAPPVEDPEEDFRKKLQLLCTGSIDLPDEPAHKEETHKHPFQAFLALLKRL